jgi:hypothetical protein
MGDILTVMSPFVAAAPSQHPGGRCADAGRGTGQDGPGRGGRTGSRRALALARC